jgi:hypothetical protein
MFGNGFAPSSIGGSQKVAVMRPQSVRVRRKHHFNKADLFFPLLVGFHSARWQATLWPGLSSRRGGSSVLHRSTAMGHLG